MKCARLLFRQVVLDNSTNPPVDKDVDKDVSRAMSGHGDSRAKSGHDDSLLLQFTTTACSNCSRTSCRTFFSTPPAEHCMPTEARLRQKERLKLIKEKGQKPGKRKKHIEDGNDDCGDSLSGLGSDVALYGLDMHPAGIHIDSDHGDHDADMCMQVPASIPDGTGDIFSMIASLCYGQHNSVDLLELCGGTAGISKAAFRRGLASGGNIDLTTVVILATLRSKRPSTTTLTLVLS